MINLRSALDRYLSKAYPIGYFHIDIAEFQTVEDKLYLYVAIDRTNTSSFVQLVRKTGRTSASAFLEVLIAAVPYKTTQFSPTMRSTSPSRRAMRMARRQDTQIFDMRFHRTGSNIG